MKNLKENVDVARIEAEIQLLKISVKEPVIKPFISILEAITQAPDDASLLEELFDSFQNLGITQGAVLTYAPSIYHLVVDDPFANDPFGK